MRADAARTRERLQLAALELFERQGFDSTTAAEVARHAGVSEMTFFRHFATKDAAVLDDPYDPVVAAVIAETDAALPDIRRVAAGLRAAWAALPEPQTDVTRRRIALIASSPSLRAGVARNQARTEDVIVDALTASGSDPLDARVATAASLSAISAALMEWSSGDAADLGGCVRRALEIVEGER